MLQGRQVFAQFLHSLYNCQYMKNQKGQIIHSVELNTNYIFNNDNGYSSIFRWLEKHTDEPYCVNCWPGNGTGVQEVCQGERDTQVRNR